MNEAQAYPGISRFFERYRNAFEVDAPGHVVLKNVDLIRILFGALYLHKYADVLGYAAIADNPGAVWWASLGAIALAGFVLIGFLTPLALVLMMYWFVANVPFSRSLGEQVMAMTIIGLLLFGAGRDLGVDGWLIRKGRFKRLYGVLYALSAGLTRRNIGLIRLILLGLYWSASIGAMLFHYEDALWWQGGVLQIALTTHYWNDHADAFIAFMNEAPLLFHILCVAGLYVQAAFELAMVPLMFLGRIGRIFVLLQGLAFFFTSAVFLNLGYLPYVEILLWGLIFSYCAPARIRRPAVYYDDRCGLCRATIRRLKRFDLFDALRPVPLPEAPPDVQQALNGEAAFVVADAGGKPHVGYDAYVFISRRVHPYWILYPVMLLGRLTGIGPAVYAWVAERRARLFGVCSPYRYQQPEMLQPYARLNPATFLAVAAFVCLAFHLQNTSRITGAEWARHSFFAYTSVYSRTMSVFGQRAVNVFNKTDLELGDRTLVIAQVDDSGRPIRVVPFLDRNGGRLDYLRNDYLYFQMSLKWQRTKNLGVLEREHAMDERTQQLFEAVVALDSRVTGMRSPGQYEALVLKRELVDGSYFHRWSEFAELAHYRLNVTADMLAEWEQSYPAYVLPPGQFASERREAQTLEWLLRLRECE